MIPDPFKYGIRNIFLSHGNGDNVSNAVSAMSQIIGFEFGHFVAASICATACVFCL